MIRLTARHHEVHSGVECFSFSLLGNYRARSSEVVSNSNSLTCTYHCPSSYTRPKQSWYQYKFPSTLVNISREKSLTQINVIQFYMNYNISLQILRQCVHLA